MITRSYAMNLLIVFKVRLAAALNFYLFKVKRRLDNVMIFLKFSISTMDKNFHYVPNFLPIHFSDIFLKSLNHTHSLYTLISLKRPGFQFSDIRYTQNHYRWHTFCRQGLGVIKS